MRFWVWKRNASDAEIKKAYRKLRHEIPPDQNPGDKTAEEKFKEINEAYEVLSDADKKARYDQYGFAGVDPNFNPNAGAGFGGGFGGFGGFGDLGDIFGDFFGGGASSSSRRTGPQKGQNIVAEIEISFEDAAFGCEREITFQRIEPCSTCHGTGAKEGSKPRDLYVLPGPRHRPRPAEFHGHGHAVRAALPEVRRQGHHHQRPVPDL